MESERRRGGGTHDVMHGRGHMTLPLIDPRLPTMPGRRRGKGERLNKNTLRKSPPAIAPDGVLKRKVLGKEGKIKHKATN